MKIGHVSDLHIFAPNTARKRTFLNKRLLGGANLFLKRSKSHSNEVARLAIQQLIHTHEVDHVAVSGDLSNLAMLAEFQAARDLFESISPDAHSRISVVPGNHDAYIPQVVASRDFETVFAPFLNSDLPGYALDSGYPTCRLLGEEVALIGLSSAIPSPPMCAFGRVDPRELRALDAMLDDPRVRSRFVIVMLHHPLLPFEHSHNEASRRLLNADEVLRLLRLRNVPLAIHGHNHYFHHLPLPHLGAPGTLHICEPGSASVTSHRDSMRRAKFNIYHIQEGELARIQTYAYDAVSASFTLWRDEALAKNPRQTSRAAE